MNLKRSIAVLGLLGGFAVLAGTATAAPTPVASAPAASASTPRDAGAPIPTPGPIGSTPRDAGAPTCDVVAATSFCQKQEDRAYLLDVLAALQRNRAELMGFKSILSGKYAELDAAEKKLLGVTDNFTLKLAGTCTVAALEAMAVGKLLGTAKGACSAGTFAYQCSRVGFTSKEITTYLARNKEVQGAVAAIALQTAAVTAKSNTPGSSGVVSYIPIVGQVCKAYNWGTQIFTAPDVIAEIGRSKAQIMREQGKVDALIRDTDRLIKETQDKLSKL